jgi:DNA-directed RNA polymerase I subunit RPA1
VFNFVTLGLPPFSLKAPIKVSGEYWGKTSGELEIILNDNELLCGVIDKAQFGKYGIIHSFQELYGAQSAGRLLSVFSRLFTAYLQMHGFTCGIGDLLLVPKAEKQRRHKLHKTEKLGDGINAQYVGINENAVDVDMEEVKNKVEKKIQSKGEVASARLDMLMTSALNRITSDINNTIFPRGLLKPFPSNCLSLMTITGAKGGLVLSLGSFSYAASYLPFANSLLICTSGF